MPSAASSDCGMAPSRLRPCAPHRLFRRGLLGAIALGLGMRGLMLMAISACSPEPGPVVILTQSSARARELQTVRYGLPPEEQELLDGYVSRVPVAPGTRNGSLPAPNTVR